jgi:hypothetical protein
MELARLAIMTKMLIASCAVLYAGVINTATAAVAAVCVDVDTSRDTLSESDRNATRFLLAQALQREGIQVGQQDCAATYTVYHVKLGNSITVFLQGPQGHPLSTVPAPIGYRQATARALEDVPPIYSQMVRSLVSGQAMSAANDTVDRTNATAVEQAPNRVEADSLWYARLGYGGVLGPQFGHGPAFGFGYRYELDALGVDLSFFNFMVANNSGGNVNGSGSSGITGSWIKLMALYFLNPTANRSSYLGGGVGWGATAAESTTSTATPATNATTYSSYSGTGLQGELSAGYELLRASTIRMFVQADATLPLYQIHSTTFDGTATYRTVSSYAPSFALTFGIGWGRSVTRVHVVN